MTLAAQVAAIPLLIRALGMEGFAAFQVALSLAPWFAVAAFGQDRALKNALAVAPPEARAGLKAGVVAWTFPRFVGLALGATGLTAATWPLLGPAGRAFDAPASALAVALMALVGYLSLVREALFGEDRGAVAGWTQATAMALVLAAIGVLALTPPAAPGAAVVLALAAWFGPQVAAWLVAARAIGLRPLPAPGDHPKPLAGGGGFVAASYLILICLNLDVVVLATQASAVEVVHYTLVAKVLAVHSMAVAAFLAFAWVRWTREAVAWTGRTHALVAASSVAAASATLAGTAIALPPVAALLGVPGLILPPPLLAALGLALALRTAGEALTTRYLATGRTRAFVVGAAVQAAVTLAGQVAAVRLGMGAAGVLAATAAGWLALAAALAAWSGRQPNE
jgi:hypothetical protein